MNLFLKEAERESLIRIIAELPNFIDGGARGFRLFLQSVNGLGLFAKVIDLSGPSDMVATDIVLRFEKLGRLEERPVYHALGALAAGLLKQREVAAADKELLATLISVYSLVADPEYVAELRNHYGITAPVAQPMPAILPERVGPPPPSPDFAPDIADESGLERIINSADNFLDIHLMVGALYSSQAVGIIEYPEGVRQATGFLAGPDLVLTNQHVFKNPGILEQAVMRFGYLDDPLGTKLAGQVFRFVPGFYHASPELELDYALVRLKGQPLQSIRAQGDLLRAPIAELLRQGKHRGYLELTANAPLDDSRVNIIQHPGGQTLKVVLTQNQVVRVTDTRIQYVADTMDGSSGSPVFNHLWQVIGLHHSGKPHPPESVADAARKAWKGRFRVNEGIPMRRILKDLEATGLDEHLPR